MADTARSGAPESLNGDNHANHNGVGSISPDVNHNSHMDDNFHYYGAQHEPNDHHHQNNFNNSSGHNSLDHGMNGDGLDTQPRYLTNASRGRVNNYYVNGDKFFPGKKIVHNPKYFKDMPHYLDYLTDKLEPRFGAIRKICTPRHGHRVLSLQDIRENCDYVVVGAERFKPFPYDQITSLERKKSPPFKYDANPVVHNRRLQHSGKINKIQTQSKLIKVWANGDDLHAPRVVLLSPKTPFTLVNVLELVSESIKTLLNGPAEKLYLLNGIKVMDVDQITHNGQYVALKKTDRFRMCRYNESGTKNITTSPRLERKFLAPLNYSRSNNSTQSSPEHSNASTQNSVNGHPPRRRAARRDDEQVFPARPVKHTRSSEKARHVDLDKDQGGMFKAKQNNRTTHGAREVQETRHTRTELPVDQRQAKTVEEEKLPKGKKPQPTRNGPPAQTGGAEARANSKRSPPTNQQQQRQQQQQQVQRQKPQKKESPANKYDDFERQKSAAKIQAGYRGYKTRQELKSKKNRVATPPRASTPKKTDDYRYNNNFDDDEEERNRGHQSRENSFRKQSQPEPAFQAEDTLLGEEERAAAKIQAGFRGFQTRRKLREQNEEQERERRRGEEERAATKIQAGYRGYSSRKNTRTTSMAATPPPPAPAPARQNQVQPREDSYDSLDREISAATKIQSSYRGYVTRRELDRKREAAVILPLNHNEVDRGSNDGKETYRLEDEMRVLTPQDIDRGINEDKSYSGPNNEGKDVPKSYTVFDNERQSPIPHPSHPRSPTPPQISNDRAVDRFRSSFGDIHKAADSETKTPSRPASSQHPSRANGEADENEVPKQEQDTPRASPVDENEVPKQKQITSVEDTPRASPVDHMPSPRELLGEFEPQKKQELHEPAQSENDALPPRDERAYSNGEAAAAAVAAAAAEVAHIPEGHGKQNGHTNLIEGSQALENDVSN